MKTIWNCVISFADSLCRARAAAELSRRGMYKEAAHLMQK